MTEDGGHIWRYLKTDEEYSAWPQNYVDKYWLGLPLVFFQALFSCLVSDTVQDLPSLPPAKDPLSAARNGFTFLKHLQADDGHWPGEYGGPMFLIPGLVIGSYVTGMPFKQEERLEFIRYLFNTAHTEHGGWGMSVFTYRVISLINPST